MATTDMAFPQLETKRLILRKMTSDDNEALFRLWSDDEVTRYMSIPSLTNPNQAERIVVMLNQLFERREAIRWAIVRKEDGALVGTVGYNNWEKKLGHRGEVGYELGREYWGQGIMTEALSEVVRYGFEVMDLNRIEAMVLPGAHRSMNLLRRLGFQWEGVLREHGYWKGRFWDEICLSLLKREWADGVRK